MKFNRLLSKISIIFMLFLAFSSCSVFEKTQEAIRNEVVATYTGREITRGEVEDYFAGFKSVLIERYGDNYSSDSGYINEQLKAFARNYAENSILIQEFDNRGIATQEEIEEEVDNSVSEIMHLFIDEENGTLDDGHGHKINEEQLKSALNQSFYLDIEDYRNKQIDSLKIDKLINDVIKDVQVSDDELMQYYEDNKDEKYITKPGAIMYHILVDTEEEAINVKERIQSGENYEDIASELNKDSTSQTGGSLGYVEYDSSSYDADFLAGARELNEGEISDPVETQFGYHIIKVTNIRRESEYDDFESVKSEIEEQLLSEKKQNLVLEFSENLFKEKNLKVR